jgi:two-component system response regulator PilR (NtrC family)
VAAGRFRQDLFYRLDVIELKMPPLRECRDDIGLLAQSILERLARESGMPVPRLRPEALEALAEYPFPGNVRELENILERALALTGGGEIGVADLHLAPLIEAEQDGASLSLEAAGGTSLQEHLDRVEKQAILEALQKTRFNRTAAAKLLGVTFRSLRYRMERLGLNENRP